MLFVRDKPQLVNVKITWWDTYSIHSNYCFSSVKEYFVLWEKDATCSKSWLSRIFNGNYFNYRNSLFFFHPQMIHTLFLFKALLQMMWNFICQLFWSSLYRIVVLSLWNEAFLACSPPGKFHGLYLKDWAKSHWTQDINQILPCKGVLLILLPFFFFCVHINFSLCYSLHHFEY